MPALFLVLALARPALAAEAFSFAVIADTHLGRGDDGGPRRRLLEAIEKVRGTEAKFVLIVGDITDSAQPSQYAEAKALFDTLPVPYFPLLGNHDVWPYRETQARAPIGDAIFEATFAPVFAKRAAQFPGLIKEPGPTWDPERKVVSWFQNYAFFYGGYAFVALDWVSRRHAIFPLPGAHAQADLHDFPGGTFQWAETLEDSGALKGARRVFLFQHHPLRLRFGIPDWGFGFSSGEKEKLKPLLERPENWGVFAGHEHRAERGPAFAPFTVLLGAAGVSEPPEPPEISDVDGLLQVETNASMKSAMVTLVTVAKDGEVAVRQF